MFDRLRQSLAFRLAILYSLVFALGACALIAAFVWSAERALEGPAILDINRRADDLVSAYQQSGIPGLKAESDVGTSTGQNSYFIRVIGPNSETQYLFAPSEWVATEISRIPFGFVANQTVRAPKDADRDYLITSRKLENEFTLQVGRINQSRAVLLASLRPTFIALGLGSIAIAVAAGVLLAWRATKPLRAVSETTRRILDTGDLNARVPSPAGGDELATLARQLNTLLDKNSAHVSVLRETLDNIAHDMRTPLTRLRGTAELALQKSDNAEEAREALADCVEQSDRLYHLLESLLDISAAEAGALKLNRQKIDLRSLVERGVELYREVAELKGINFFVQLAPVEARVDPIRMGQAVNNLIDNALKYTPNGGKVIIGTMQDYDRAVITVTDTGPGVPVAERAKIWRRLYRSDSSRSQRGLGLGLSLVKAIVEAHGGTASVDEASGGGARFELRLPRE